MIAKPAQPAFWNDVRVRAHLLQLAMVLVVGAIAAYLIHNTAVNMQRQGIASGFGFLSKEAAFAIGETLIAYSPADNYGRALLVGLLNTLYVALIGIFLATLLGTIIGIARLSTNWLIRKLASVYVELFRNVPLLLQLIFWWTLLRESAPGPRDAWHVASGIFVSNRGLVFPDLVYDPIQWWVAGVFALSLVASLCIAAWAKRHQIATGAQFPVIRTAVGLTVGLPALVFVAGGMPFEWTRPVLRGFNFVGGRALSPEFCALLLGLVIYTASFIAEIVRGGIKAVSWGQSEAAMALGLKRGLILRLVVLPQALRVIVPPMTSQYLNLTKNSSLAIAIGYPDLVAVLNTTINQTGQAVEGVALIMAAYLTVSLLISLFMNWYNAHIALVER